MTEGIILKGIGGFYYVDTPEGLIECKARGKFRKTVGKPIVGDRVQLEVQPDGTGYLMSIAPRRNSLIRPAVANLDLVVAVASAAPPVTDPFLIDKVTAIAVHKEITPLVVINKTDADAGDELYETYRKSGIEVLRTLAEEGFPSQIPVFLITAEASGDTMKEAYQLGVMDVISKPVIPYVLERRVNSVV